MGAGLAAARRRRLAASFVEGAGEGELWVGVPRAEGEGDGVPRADLEAAPLGEGGTEGAGEGGELLLPPLSSSSGAGEGDLGRTYGDAGGEGEGGESLGSRGWGSSAASIPASAGGAGGAGGGV